MIDMEKVFAGCTVSTSDSFVVDYTNDDDKGIAKRGVEITHEDPGYMHGAFHLIFLLCKEKEMGIAAGNEIQ